MPAVKEAHYWDTFDPDQCETQLAAFRLRLTELRVLKGEAKLAGRGWQVTNVDRRIIDMKGLMAVLEGDRAGDLTYAQWLLARAQDAKVVADMTPNYAMLPDDTLKRMVRLSPETKFIYLMRDPLDRLWSHIRMQARRQRQTHEVYEKKSNNILYRMINRGQETHILERGDYPGVIRKLRRVVPKGRLLVAFTEDMTTPDGIARICAFLGITPVEPKPAPVHAGPEVEMLDKLRPKALRLVIEDYEWVAQHVGPLPQHWQDNRARAMV